MKTYEELRYEIVENWRWDEITREEMESQLNELKKLKTDNPSN